MKRFFCNADQARMLSHHLFFEKVTKKKKKRETDVVASHSAQKKPITKQTEHRYGGRVYNKKVNFIYFLFKEEKAHKGRYCPSLKITKSKERTKEKLKVQIAAPYKRRNTNGGA